MQIQRSEDKIVVSADLPEGHQEISLRPDEAGRLMAGESFLRKGLIIRRWGDTVELRNARPGISKESRILATMPVDQFVFA